MSATSTFTFDESIAYLAAILLQSDGTTIVVGVTDDSVLRAHAVDVLRQRLESGARVYEFTYDAAHLSLFEAAGAAITESAPRVVVSAAGIETLPRDQRTEAIRLLNLERNRFGRTGVGVVLWVNQATLTEIATWSADFYSWRSGTVFLEPPPDWDGLASRRRAYLEAVLADTEYVSLQGLAPMRGGQIVQMRMDDIFIPLQAEIEEHDSYPIAYLPEDDVEPAVYIDLRDHGASTDGSQLVRKMVGGQIAPEGRLSIRVFRGGQPNSDSVADVADPSPVRQLTRETGSRPVEIADLWHEKRAVVLGDPGAGKTTLLRNLARRVALSQVKADSDLTEGVLADVQDCLPVYVRLAEYAAALQREPDASLLECAVDRSWTHQIPLTRDILESALGASRVLFLLDGLDEVIDPAERRTVARQVEDLARQQPGCRIVVTSRLVGYREARLTAPFAVFTIKPFDDEEIGKFVQQWYAALETPDAAGPLREAILGAAAEPSIRRLASNPLLITVIALIHWRGTKLPSQRVEVYRAASETLVDQWMSQRRVTPEGWDVKEVLQTILPAVAWRLHQSSTTGLMNEDELVRLVADTLLAAEPHLGEHRAAARADQFRRNVSEFSGIFLERGLEQYGFLHLTFEEYFAGLHLAEQWSRAGSAVFVPLLHDPRWTEPILLAAGHFGSFSQHSATQFVRDILEANSPYEGIVHRDLFLAARCLADEVRVDPDLRHEVIARLSMGYFGSAWARTLGADALDSLGRLLGTAAGAAVEDVLLERLDSEDGSVRRAVARAVGWLGTKAASSAIMDRLLALLSDMDAEVRQATAFALGRLRTAATESAVVDGLMTLLNDTDLGVRLAATEALGNLGPSGAKPAVTDALLAFLSETVEVVRVMAAQALGELGPSAAKPAVTDALLALLSETDVTVRMTAAQALGRLGAGADKSAVVDGLAVLLSDPNLDVRLLAATALRTFRAGATAAAVADELLAPLSDMNAELWGAVDEVLGQFSPGATEPSVTDGLLAHLDDSDADVRRAAAAALGSGAASAEVVDALVVHLGDTNVKVQEAAAGALGQLGAGAASPSVVDGLLALLGDADVVLRWIAVRALGDLSAHTSGNDRDAFIRIFAAAAESSEATMKDAGYVGLRNVLASA